jgi:hypothetical protein
MLVQPGEVKKRRAFARLRTEDPGKARSARLKTRSRRESGAVDCHGQFAGRPDDLEQLLSHASEHTRPAVRGRLRVYLIAVAAVRVRYRTASGAQPLRVQRVVRRNLVHRVSAGVYHGCCQRGAPKRCSRVPGSRSPFTAARHARYQLPGPSRDRPPRRPSCGPPTIHDPAASRSRSVLDSGRRAYRGSTSGPQARLPRPCWAASIHR